MLRFSGLGRLVLLVVLAVLFRVETARAQTPDPAESTDPQEGAPEESGELCLASHREGQHLERSGELLAARRAYQRCLQPLCSPVLREDCGDRLVRVESDLPTVIVAVQHRGKDLVDGEVYDNDEPLAGVLRGVAVPVDPGPHHFRFVAPGFTPVSKSIVARVGEKNRVVDLVVELEGEDEESASPAPTQAEPKTPEPTESVRNESPSGANHPLFGPWEYGLFSAGAAAGVGGVVFGVLALHDFEQAREECSPHCSDRRMNRIRAKAYTADALFALSAVAVVTGSVRLVLAKRRQTSAALVLTPQSLIIEGCF